MKEASVEAVKHGLMQGLAGPLSDTGISDLAAYFSSL